MKIVGFEDVVVTSGERGYKVFESTTLTLAATSSLKKSSRLWHLTIPESCTDLRVRLTVDLGASILTRHDSAFLMLTMLLRECSS